jgi:hypothetical protein
MGYNKSNNWNYSPKKFKDCVVGDVIYFVETGRNFPTLRAYEIVSEKDVDLKYPDRHWKKFSIREVESVYATYPWMFRVVTFDGRPSTIDLEIYGYDAGSWMEEWCGFKVFSDKKVAFHSCQRHLKKRMKKNAGRLKKIQAALDYESNMMQYIYDSFTPDELNELNIGIDNETTNK